MKPGRLQAALLGGATMGVLSALPILNVANCCCLWVVGGGALAVYILQLNQAEAVSSAEGALTGLLAGLLGVVVWLAVTVVIDLLFGQVLHSVHGRMIDVIRDSDLPPEVRRLFDGAGRDTAGLKWLVLLGEFLLQAVIWPLFSTLGGLIGTVLFRPASPRGDLLPPSSSY
jgi:hypothetical protein